MLKLLLPYLRVNKVKNKNVVTVKYVKYLHIDLVYTHTTLKRMLLQKVAYVVTNCPHALALIAISSYFAKNALMNSTYRELNRIFQYCPLLHYLQQ